LAISISERLPYDHEHTIVFIELLSSASILFFGEIGPKILGITVPDTIGLAVAPIYRSIFAFFRPISLGVEYFVKIISLITGTKIEMHGKKVSEEEFDAFIDMSHEGGAVEADERRQIKNLLSLSDMTAEAVLTPRVNVEFLSLDMTIDEACTFFMESSHSRIPVYGETTDDIDYVITFREAFKLQREGFGKAQLGSLTLEKIMKVPGTQPLDDLFEKFQKSRRHIALVVDEHGGTAGIVTMEDVLEEVFGDIKDEHDKEEIYIRKTGPRKIEAIGMVLIEDVLEEWNISPDDIYLPEEYQNESLAYIIMAEK
jgi:CBS domain containing-hemolysin-like protein